MKQKKRIINFEVLRVLAMFFIVTQHYCYWGLKSSEWYHFMPMKSSMDIFNYISIEALFLISVIGVDCFVLITGYFLIDRLSFRWKGMASNLHIWNYGVNTCKQRRGGEMIYFLFPSVATGL